MTAPENQSDWLRLFRIARDLIQQANSEAPVINSWTFGGGTAMMLQIDHRESHDVDIFLDDAQLLPFLDPQKHDFQFEIKPSDYGGDGSRFIKLAFNGIGEIDFIVGSPKTAEPTIEREILGQKTLLESIPEIITKKIVYRGAIIKPRDIFDIAAAGETRGSAIVEALRPFKDDVLATLKTLDRLNPEFVNGAISELQIRDRFRDVAKTALEKTKQLLLAV